MKITSGKGILIISLATFLLAGCSLKYGQVVSAEETNPEFVFTNTKYSRYDKGKLTATVEASQMEEYKNTSAVYAKDVNFQVINEKGEIETDGSCGLMYADTEKEVYEFFDGITIFSDSIGGNFSANVLKWDGKTQQLTGGRTDHVFVEKDNTTLYGSGFAASGVSGKFSFKNSAEGDITTESVEEAQKEVEKGGAR